MLYIVCTPIGNLKDITFRAVEVLKEADLIACEDTRHTKILLDYYGISRPTTSFFQHNRFTKGAYLLRLLKDGKKIALVSDAGTPGILDPGYNLINLAVQNNIAITFVPGPTAFVHALVVSGKPAHEFIFAGFLPSRTEARKNRLKKLKSWDSAIILYESCHRIIATLKDIEEVFGDRDVVLARELTKKFEEVLRGKVSWLIKSMETRKPRGEFVLVL